MLADYHVHTNYSDDSITPMEEQIVKAISLGLEEICFTDHVDYGIKKDWTEGDIVYRGAKGKSEPLANVDYPRYFEEISQLQQKYANQIAIKSGLEFGIQTHWMERYEKLYSTYGEKLDFILLSIHQVEDKEFWTQDFQSGKTQQEYNEQYYQQMYDVMKVYKNYSALAHLDLIVRYDKQGVYPFEKVRDMVAEILKLAIADGKGLEINTSSWRYKLKDTQPSREILKLYKDLGGKIITIGSDAHTPEYLGAYVKEAKEILKTEIGFDQICTYERMIPVFHEL